MNSKADNLPIKMELLWWLFTAILLVLILLPIYHYTDHYPFWRANILFIITFVTLTRYVFLLKHTFIAKKQILKIALFFLSIPTVFFLVSELFYFQEFLDEQGLESIFDELGFEERNRIVRFIRTELLLFGVGSIIIAIIFPFRMLMSVWLLHNRGRV